MRKLGNLFYNAIMSYWRGVYKYIILFYIATFCYAGKSQPLIQDSGHPILIISSYNPDSRNTSTNISDFIDEYDKLGGLCRVLIENMNCKSFSESRLWKKRMKNILDKYKGNNQPRLIILLGQEAWASYLSQEGLDLVNIPVLAGMASKNAVILPDENVSSLKDWYPDPINFISDSLSLPIRGGFIYDYDLKKNVQLIQKLYPETENIAFISDNTYGGVSMQAWVREEIKKYQI